MREATTTNALQKRSILWILGVAGAALVLYGCDTLVDGGETIFLQPKQVTFRFTVASEQLTPNSAVTLPAVAAVDLGTLVSQDGYTKADVVSVRIENAVLRRRQPLAVNLGFLRNVDVSLHAQAGSPVSVATLASPPADNMASLQVVSGRDVAAQVTGQSFSARLQFVPITVLPNEDYELEVTLDLRIEVEG